MVPTVDWQEGKMREMMCHSKDVDAYQQITNEIVLIVGAFLYSVKNSVRRPLCLA